MTSTPIVANTPSPLLDRVMRFASGLPEARVAELRRRLAALLIRITPAEEAWARARIAQSEVPWGFTPPTELARKINQLMCEATLLEGSELSGDEHLADLEGQPILLVANHLSMADAHLVQHLLGAAGHEQMAARLTAVAGPKVLDDPIRRYTCTAFGTILTPQSQTRASDGAVMSVRATAALAQQSIAAAFERLALGDLVLLFPEGTRSRDGRMQSVLPGIVRYLRHPGTRIVPLGIVGAERVMPLGDDRLHLARVRMRVGPSMDAAALLQRCGGNNQRVAQCLGHSIAALLDPDQRGAYAA